ncbi:MAG: hypothetical protein WDM92_14695 [Caulobacteraceae bacterium]
MLDHANLARDFAAMVQVLYENGVIAERTLPLLRVNASDASDCPEAHAAFLRWCAARQPLERTGAAAASVWAPAVAEVESAAPAARPKRRASVLPGPVQAGWAFLRSMA